MNRLIIFATTFSITLFGLALGKGIANAVPDRTNPRFSTAQTASEDATSSETGTETDTSGATLVATPGSNSLQNQANREARQQAIQDKKEKFIETKCKAIETKISNKLATFDNRKAFHIKIYQNVRTRVNNVVNKWTGRGYDTTKLKADLTTLDTMIKDATSLYTAHIEDLRATQTYACGKSQGEFVSQLNTSRKSFTTFNQKLAEIRNFIKTTIVPDLTALKDQIKQKTATASPTVSPSPTLTSSPLNE